MKNLDRLFIVSTLFIVLACRCQWDPIADKYKEIEKIPIPTPNSTPPIPANSASPANTSTNQSVLGEERSCSQRGILDFSKTGDYAPLVISNKSTITLSIYRLGPNNYESKYETLTPGKTVSLRSSRRGDWWMIKHTDSGHCSRIVSPPNVITLK
jgi:hypothetical protein